MRRRSAVVVAGLVSLIVVAYLAYDLLKGVVSPCETIYEQTSVRLGTSLELLQTKGELHLGREKVQDLTEAAQMTALNLKTCCIVLDQGGVDSAELLQCKRPAQDYEAQIEMVAASIEEAGHARQTGDTGAYEEMMGRINQTLEEARQASRTLEQELNALVESKGGEETDQPRAANTELSADAVNQAMGELAFTWDGKTQTYWNILKADAAGEYGRVAQTGWLQKGETQVVELTPGNYRVGMNWDRGFEPQDVTIEPGERRTLRPDFGTVTFTWDGRSEAYWNILEADAFGDYHKVEQTAWLQKGQVQVVELAPGDYRVSMHWDRGFDSEEVAVETGKDVAIGPVFGTVTFQWDGRTQAYWNILQGDAFGDYHKVEQTGWLQKGGTQIVELAPGDYRVD
ncbi:MAG: hypothetical protein AAF637_15915, partial [Pseudomonadota bacterium]